MGGYIYLSDQVKRDIGEIIDRTFQELDISAPPVNYDWLYQSEKLARETISLQNLKSLNLKEVGRVQEQLRGLLFVPQRQVFVIDE